MFVSYSSLVTHLFPIKIACGLDYLPQEACFQAKKDIWLCSALPRTFSYGGKGYKTLHCTRDWGFLPAGHLLQGKEWKGTTIALAESISFANYFTAKINFEKAPLWNLFIYSLRWREMFLQSSLHSVLQVRWSPVQPGKHSLFRWEQSRCIEQ